MNNSITLYVGNDEGRIVCLRAMILADILGTSVSKLFRQYLDEWIYETLEALSKEDRIAYDTILEMRMKGEDLSGRVTIS